MKNKTLKYVLASTMLFGVGTLASCGEVSNLAKDNPNYMAAVSDSTAYDITLGKFEAKYQEASKVQDLNERFVRMAEAEADLLASGVFVPTTTQGGAYTLSRVAFRTAPYVQWGPDGDRLHSLVVTEPSEGKTFIKKADREALKELWQKGVAGEGEYSISSVKAWLQAQGYTVANEYKTSFSTLMQTFDALATSKAVDTDFIVNGLDGLVQYDHLGRLQPRMAKRLESGALYTVSEDGLEVTFEINTEEKWVKSDGTQYAKVSADDFVAGFQHMLDAAGGLEWLVDGVIENASEYVAGSVTFDKVGVKASEDGKSLTYKLVKPIPYFETMLSYNIFFPMNRAFFLEQGGKFGTEFGDVKASDSYTYGKNKDSILYNGAYICTEATAGSKVTYEKNEAYSGVRGVDKISFLFDAGEDLSGSYRATVNGTYSGTGLSNATLPLAREDGNFDAYAYISDTNSTTYFGGWNLNRRTFALANGAVASPKTSDEARQYAAAILNQNFRSALSHSLDRVTFNAVARGTDLAKTNLRNMYTSPNFVQLSAPTTDAAGHQFGLGTSYGEMVQHYIDLNYNGEYKVADGDDGWYKPELAKAYIQKAAKQLDPSVFETPVQIDIEYYGASANQKGQAEAMKASIEEALKVGDKQYVVVNIIAADTVDDYYNAGYDAPTGHDTDYDLFYGSGWGPDYGDPSTYLDTYTRTGYMIKVQGLNAAN